MKRPLIATLAFVAGTLPAFASDLPEGMTQAQIDAFERAMINVGCEVRSEATGLQVEAQTGMTNDQLIQVREYLIEESRLAETEDGIGIRLIHAECQ